MKALFITSATNETIKYGESFACLPGNEIESCRYTNRQPPHRGKVAPGTLDEEVYAHAVRYQPDLMVYIGSRWGEMPSIGTLQSLNKNVAPVVHLCSDAADHPWWDLLEEYDRAKCFSLQVAIDGNKQWPLHAAPLGLTSLTPFDPSRFSAPPHTKRPIVFGYSGSMGGKAGKFKRNGREVVSASSMRRQILDALVGKGLQVRERVDHNQGLADQTYQDYVDYMARCRITVNVPYSGTQKHMQVKGRVVEAGMAGCVLLDLKGAPTADWFTPGEDYFEYESPADAAEIVARLAAHPDVTQEMGMRLRAKVLAEHGPDKFWGRILARVGLRDCPLGYKQCEEIGCNTDCLSA